MPIVIGIEIYIKKLLTDKRTNREHKWAIKNIIEIHNDPIDLIFRKGSLYERKLTKPEDIPLLR